MYMSTLNTFDVKEYLRKNKVQINLDDAAEAAFDAEDSDDESVPHAFIATTLRELKERVGGVLCDPLEVTRDQIIATQTCQDCEEFTETPPAVFVQAVIEELAWATAEQIIEDLLGFESLVKTLDDEEFDEQISQARDALQPKIRVILAEKIL